MKELRNHPCMSNRTIKAWETNSGEFLQIIDVRDIFHWNYSVEFELDPGGLDSIYSSPNLEKCFDFVKRFAERNPTR